MARSRLYRSRFLQVNTRLKALAQRYTQLIGCESAVRRLNHFTWNFWVLTLDVLARGIHLLSNLSGSFRAFSLVFSSFRTGFRSSKEYSRYRSNITF